MKFIIKDSVDNQFVWTLHADNGQVLATSETYKRKGSCRTTVDRLNERFRRIHPVIDQTKPKKKK